MIEHKSLPCRLKLQVLQDLKNPHPDVPCRLGFSTNPNFWHTKHFAQKWSGIPYVVVRFMMTQQAPGVIELCTGSMGTNNVLIPPPPLDIDNEIVLEAWLGFQAQVVGPSMNSLVLLFCLKYSVSAPHDLNSSRSILQCLSERPVFERVAFATSSFAT